MANIWRRLPSGRIDAASLRKNSNSSTSPLVADDFFEAASGPATITGSMAVTDSADSGAFVGDVAHVGTLAVTDSADTAAFAGDLSHAGTMAATDATDTAAFAGDIAHVGSLAATDAEDGFAADGTVSSGATTITGDMAASDSADSLEAGGSVSTAEVIPYSTHSGGGGGLVRITSKPKRKEFDRLWEDLLALYEELSADAVVDVQMSPPVIEHYIKPAEPKEGVIVIPLPTIDWGALNRDITRLYLLIEQNKRLLEDEDEAEFLLFH